MSNVTEQAWQADCTQALEKAVAAGPRTGKDQWEAFRASVPETAKRIIIADANFSGQSLSGFDLSRCYVTRTSFKKSNLSHASLSQSIFRRCDATGANIEGANFRDADMRSDGLVLLDCRYDPQTVFEVAPEALPTQLPRGLVDAAMRSLHERRWRNRRAYAPAFRFILWLTQYGYSFGRLITAGTAVVILFGFGFVLEGDTPEKAILSSLAYFLNLDAAHSSGWPFFVGQVEALIGLLFFAVLTAILVSNFLERS